MYSNSKSSIKTLRNVLLCFAVVLCGSTYTFWVVGYPIKTLSSCVFFNYFLKSAPHCARKKVTNQQEGQIWIGLTHCNDVIMGSIASQITSLAIVYSAVYSGAEQRKHQSSASLAFVRGIHRRPVNSPHKWPVTRKMFPFDDVIMHFSQVCFTAVPVMLKTFP